MNRISLYEAIRRKKDAEGLNLTPQAQSAPSQTERSEAKFRLKQSPVQGKSAMRAETPARSSLKLFLTRKKERINNYRQVLDRLRKFVISNSSSKAVWRGIAVAAAVLILFVFLPRINNGSKPPADTILPPAREAVKPPAQQPPQTQTSRQPASPPKPQLPAAIQSQLQQKPAADAKPQEPAGAAKPAGDHVIVIVAYTKQEDLAPVSAYFKKNGVETEVIRQGSYYLLITRDRFESPERAGTDGYQMKQTIKRLGASYKAPDGYEKFSRTPFQDVYGKKMK